MDSFTLWINLYSFLYSNIYAFEYKSNTSLKYVLILAIFYSTPRQYLTAHRTFCTFFKYPSGSLSCTTILFIPSVSVIHVCVPSPPFHLLSLYSHTYCPRTSRLFRVGCNSCHTSSGEAPFCFWTLTFLNE